MNRNIRVGGILFVGLSAILAFNGLVNGMRNDAQTGSNTAIVAPSPSPNTTPYAPELTEFKACVAKHGTPETKAAVKHVVKATEMDGWNGILDNPKLWTDYSGGMLEHGADATLIAAAFADCYTSNNGLVTVYDKDGHVAGAGQF